MQRAESPARIDTAERILRENKTMRAARYVASGAHHGVGAVLFRHERGCAVKPAGVASHIFALLCSGARTERTDKRQSFKGRTGGPGMTVFVSAEEESRWECEGPHTVLNFFLGTDYLAALWDEAFRVDRGTLAFRETGFCYDQEGAYIGRLVEHRLKNDGAICGLELDALAQLIGMLVLRRYSVFAGREPSLGAARLTRAMLDRTIEYMHENLASPIRLADLARNVRMSKFTFSRAFRSAVGLPPHKYLIKVRLERAERLLGSRELTVGQIAHEVGFADQSQFTSHFRGWFGTTPARYRNARAG